jgi:3-hydroxyacyl-CoA dehydrogenase/enoyl-CoA hydratase/3-hydroxybutyryl-CoA epimerase
VVRDGAGFYTSRILGAYLNEAAFLLAEGVGIERIDEALVDWGFDVGPLTLMDEVGLDVVASVGHLLLPVLGERMAGPLGLDGLLKDGRLGKKNLRGFYLYGEQKREKAVDRGVYSLLGIEPARELPKDEIASRCALQMVNEAAHCFGEGVLLCARDGDIGAILGWGFPAFRGGPFYYVDGLGAAEIVRRLESYQKAFGPRFAPAPVLTAMARAGGSFYGTPDPS